MVKRRKQAEPLERRVLNFILLHNLLAGRIKLVVAVSGGPDSVCLIRTLVSLKDELDIDLHLAHLDHQLRGADSQADARYVEMLSQQLQLPVTIEARDVNAYRVRRRISLEEAAREVRYAFLAEVAGAVGAMAVAVGHTRDDSIETILMHLIRGTGTRGLRGLLPANRLRTSAGIVRVVRPLLEVSRSETARYCGEHGLDARNDATNGSLSLFRNRIRLELLPLLRRYNPQVDEALSKVGKMAADELEYLDVEATRVWDSVAARNQDTIILDKQRFLLLSLALKRHMLRRAMGELIGDLKDIEARHIEKLLGAIDMPAGRTFPMPGGLVFVVEYDRYLLGRDLAVLCPLPILEEESSLNIPGETVASGWRIAATVRTRENSAPADDVIGGVRGGASTRDAGFTACFDHDLVGNRLTVRPPQPGDRFHPLGLGQSKKVGQFMLDAKIPRSWRKSVPIVASEKQLIWVVGWRIDEAMKVTDSTRKVLCLEFTHAHQGA